MSATLYLLEVVAYDPDTASTVTLRYASGGGHTTGPAETPANTWYDARLSNPLDITRSLFGGARTQGRARVSAGDIKLQNADGGLDGLLDYAFDGRDVTLRRGTVGAAYPAGFPVVFQGTAESIEIRRTEVILRTRDALFALNQPLQTTTYDGDNVLPDGLEGVAADLKGKPKPYALGTVKNIAPPCVNTAKLIYQVNDGAIEELDSVFDRGINLVSTYFESKTSGFGASTINHVYFGGALYVASGDAGKISTSPDGETWTARTSNFAGVACVGGCYGDGRYLVVGGAGGASSALSVSTDGVTWTRNAAAEAAFGANQMVGATYSERLGLYVVVGLGGNIITSPDTVTWTSRLSDGSSSFLAVVDGEGLLIAGGGATMRTSPDGVTWTVLSGGPLVSEIAYDRRFGFLAVANTSQDVYTSRDGLTWRTHAGVLPTTGYQGTAYGAGVFVATGAGGSASNGIVMASDPTQQWEPVDSEAGMIAGGASGRMVTYGPSGWVVGGSSGFIALSSARRADYTSEADLLDDDLVPKPGQIGVYPAGGYFRLGSPPAGLITADITQGAAASDRTAAQLWTDVLTKAGYTSADWSTSDVTALDSANAAECGLWIGPSETPTIAEVLDRIARSVGAAWYCDADGLFRIVQVTAPSGTAVLSLTANDLLEPLTLLPAQDEGRGVPVYEAVVRYAKNYVVQNSDLAFGVSDARRATLAAEWREAVATTASVQTTHLLAPRLVVETLIANAADAATEATRLQTLYGTQRRVWEVTTQLNADTAAVDLGDVVELTHDRYGLSAGVLTRVLSVEPNAARSRIRFLLWG